MTSRVLVSVALAFGLLPLVLACTFNFCTPAPAHTDCEDWDDCWPGCSGVGNLQSQYYWCDKQGSMCCYCHQAVYDCTGDCDPSGKGGYHYFRWDHSS